MRAHADEKRRADGEPASHPGGSAADGAGASSFRSPVTSTREGLAPIAMNLSRSSSVRAPIHDTASTTGRKKGRASA